MTQETAKERIYREALEKTRDRLDSFEELYANKEVYYAFDELTGLVEKGLSQASKIPVSTDNLSVEKLQEELESCIQTLIEASVAATITQDIVVGNLVDRKLADLAKTHKLAVDYIEKVTGKNIDVVLAENAALEAEEEE
ncbi:hypothetical protein LSG16_11395 [Lactococcus cremoris]|uniref:hypothetical protein n=1 Tax=Lactococcus lactis subsp. cremoris TaxID=1359 RepID=UPI001E3A9CC9|nr:hypothetical protein [Lactococcus cremoris]MCD6633431.1 hypothetical protein [Lactococcus cremoris]